MSVRHCVLAISDWNLKNNGLNNLGINEASGGRPSQDSQKTSIMSSVTKTYVFCSTINFYVLVASW